MENRKISKITFLALLAAICFQAQAMDSRDGQEFARDFLAQHGGNFGPAIEEARSEDMPKWLEDDLLILYKKQNAKPAPKKAVYNAPAATPLLISTTVLAELALTKSEREHRRLRAEDPQVSITPMHIAAKYGWTEDMLLLLQKGYSVEDVDASSYTPIMTAAMNGQTAAVKMLIQIGADVHAATGPCEEEEETAIMLASQNGHEETVQALLDAKATPWDGQRQENKELALITTKSEQDFLAYKANNPNMNNGTPMHRAAIHGWIKDMPLLQQKGYSVEDVDEAFYTPLMSAARNGQTAAVKTLIKMGADVHATTWPDYKTAIMIAEENGHAETVQALLDAKAAPWGGQGQEGKEDDEAEQPTQKQ